MLMRLNSIISHLQNYKRVAEVWMDEYKEFLYARDPEIYGSIDAGDLTAQKALREKLHCKPFKWFMEEVAFDLPKKYPPVEPPDFASGTIRSVARPDLCADSLSHGVKERVGLYSCASNHKRPQSNQYFVNSWHKDIRLRGQTKCWDVSDGRRDAPVLFYDCHGQMGNQRWQYDPVGFRNVHFLLIRLYIYISLYVHRIQSCCIMVTIIGVWMQISTKKNYLSIRAIGTKRV